MKKIKANNPVGELVTVEQMAETSNLGVSTVRRIAEEAQAVRRIGRIYRITFAKWKELGYKVKHGASALFGCSLVWGSRGNGATYKASFFGKSQVEAI